MAKEKISEHFSERNKNKIFFLDNPALYRPTVAKAIRRYGHAPEHNVFWYEYEAHPDQKPIFVSWFDSSWLMTYKEENAWYIFSEPLATPEKKVSVLVPFITHALQEECIKKVVVELTAETRKSLRQALPATLRDVSINYTLTWPIFDIAGFNLALPGRFFKRLRNTRNKFYRTHRVDVRDARGVPKADLQGIADRWKKMRGATDGAYDHRYRNLIENNFAGTQTARAIFVDGRVVAINAGWPIANRPGHYYAAVGIHDYSVPGLGEIMNLEDLEWIKNAGHQTANFGGGEKALTNFKKQFGPISYYKTFVFSIVRSSNEKQ